MTMFIWLIVIIFFLVELIFLAVVNPGEGPSVACFTPTTHPYLFIEQIRDSQGRGTLEGRKRQKNSENPPSPNLGVCTVFPLPLDSTPQPHPTGI